MKVKYSVSIKGTAIENEDALGYYKDYFWIIDGATDLFDSKSLIGYSVSEVVNLISETLPNHCDNSKTLQENFQSTLEEVCQMIGTDKLALHPSYKLPSFAFIYGRFTKDGLEYILLGDCVLFVNSEEITDHRVDEFFEKGKEKIELSLKGHPDLDKKDILRDIRILLNQPNGYWIGSLDGLGLEQALYDKIELESSEIILMTDGFYDFYSQQKLKEIEELIELRKSSVAIDPIYGKKDDASVLVIETE